MLWQLIPCKWSHSIWSNSVINLRGWKSMVICWRVVYLRGHIENKYQNDWESVNLGRFKLYWKRIFPCQSIFMLNCTLIKVKEHEHRITNFFPNICDVITIMNFCGMFLAYASHTKLHLKLLLFPVQIMTTGLTIITLILLTCQ